MEHHSFSLPISDPVLIFAIVLMAIMLIPVLLRRTSIPPIVGMIVFGVVIGPYATNVLTNSDVMVLFGKVGLLYIMFLAGLEIEFVSFRKNSKPSIFFGLFTFIIPYVFGYFSAHYLLDFNFIQASLVGILLASNTLIAFPSASRLGITKTSAATAAVSGTVIADTIVLVLLALLSTLLKGDGNSGFFTFLVTFSVFSFVLFILLPRLAAWFFKSVTTDGTTQFLFVLTSLFAAAFASELAGAEPIIGAFFAGLALNRLIPSTSTLMNRIEFVGSTLFIPFFLISVGMLIRIDVLFEGHEPLLYAAVLIVLAISSKWLAAFLTRLVFKLTSNEMHVIFGLTSARAAATLAVALIGLRYDAISNDLFNATIFLIMFSSLFSSYHTEKYGKRLAIEEMDKVSEAEAPLLQRILVPIANPATVKKLIDLAIMIHNPKSPEPIFSLSVVKDDHDARKQLAAIKPGLDEVKKHAAASNVKLETLNRIDLNVTEAIVKSTLELGASSLILGWSSRASDLRNIFGNMFEAILNETVCQVIISSLPKPLNTTERILVLVPENAELEIGFKRWISAIHTLSRQLSTDVTFYASDKCKTLANKSMQKKGSPERKKDFGYEPDAFFAEASHPKQSLFVMINSRPHSLSYQQRTWKTTFRIPQMLPDQNVLIIFPEQLEKAF